MKIKHVLGWLLVVFALKVQSAEVLHYVLVPGSTITPYYGVTPNGPTEPLSGRFDWVLYPSPITQTIIAFNAVGLNFESASYSLQLNTTPANDIMTAVHTDSNQTVFDEVVDMRGLGLATGYISSMSYGSYAGPASRPLVLNYPNVTISPLGGGFIYARLNLVAVMEGLINVAPSFTRGPDVIVLQNCGSQVFTNWATAISPGPTNEAGQSLRFLVTNNNAGLFSVAPALAPDGTLTFTPAANRSGTALLTVVLQDNGGTAYGGQDSSAPQSFSIRVLSPAEATELLLNQVLQADLGHFNKRPLVTTLQAALAAFQRGHWQLGIRHLESFQQRVQTQLMRVEPDLAAQWIGEAEDIINIFAGAPTAGAGTPPRAVAAPEY